MESSMHESPFAGRLPAIAGVFIKENDADTRNDKHEGASIYWHRSVDHQ